jgi:ApaG protein
MEQLVTQGVLVKVEARFESTWQNGQDHGNFFSYTITIRNLNESAVQLIDRHWEIRDSLNGNRSVTGPGVVGEQPVLEHGETFTYTSGCNLQGDLGSMEGFYTFVYPSNNNKFNVKIPKFDLTSPLILS